MDTPKDTPKPTTAAERFEQAAALCRAIASIARSRAASPVYAGVADVLRTIADQMDTAAAALDAEEPAVLDGVQITNAYPIDLSLAVDAAENAADNHATGFVPGFARQITDLFGTDA